MKTLTADSKEMADVAPVYIGGVRDWQRWTPYAAVVWSLLYAALGLYWAVSGRGFPYGPETASDGMRPMIGRLGAGAAWAAVVLAGMPAAVAGAAMLRGVRGRKIRPILIAAGGLLAGMLLLLMTGLKLLVMFGYIPNASLKLLMGDAFGQVYLEGVAEWGMAHQLLCLLGGFFWLAATVSYARWSGEACLYCGRRDGPEGWQSPSRAARWGRTALYVSLVAPIFYAFTRYAWALGFPLGMSEEALRKGQVSGEWISGLFLASFGLAGAALSLGLVQRWGEVFPRWMIGLAGRRVPIALAVIPAALISVMLIVGGVVITSDLPQMVANLRASGVADSEVPVDTFFQVGPTLLFPLWGLALAVTTLGYYYRRRGACKVCGRGAAGEKASNWKASTKVH